MVSKKKLGMPWWLQSSPGGWEWGNRPDVSFSHFHLFFLEVRKCPFSQTVCGGLGDVRPEFWKHGKRRQILFKAKFKQGSLLLFYCFQKQYHFLTQLLASVLKTLVARYLELHGKGKQKLRSKRFSVPHLQLFYE